jgi:hypothetical protein
VQNPRRLLFAFEITCAETSSSIFRRPRAYLKPILSSHPLYLLTAGAVSILELALVATFLAEVQFVAYQVAMMRHERELVRRLCRTPGWRAALPSLAN